MRADDREDSARTLADELYRCWNLELYEWWQHFNHEYYDDGLKRPEIRLSPGKHALGTWDRDARVIRVSIEHLRRDPWLHVMATLRHEMAHQYVDEIVRASEAPHGPEFRRACRKLRVEPRATTDVGVSDSAADESDRSRLLATVAKLMSLGSSPNQNEAESALRKARALLLRHNIDVSELNEDRDFDVRELGPVKKRHQAWEYTLSSLLNEFFFVETIWSRSYDATSRRAGTVLQVYGTRSNLQMAEFVHAFLTKALETLWADYRLARGLAGNRERMRFFEGVLSGFLEKLRCQDEELERETGLVFVGDDRLHDFFRYHNPRVRTHYGGGVRASAAYQDGRLEGRNVRIHRPVTERGSSGGFLTG